MAIDKRDNGVAIVDEYSLVEFVQSIQKLVQEGYEISLENEHYPQGMSGWFRAGLIKKEPVVEVVEETKGNSSAEVEADTSEKPKRTRTAK